MKTTEQDGQLYVPESAADFSRRAKHLAWIVQRPLQECQEILARAYGFADAHELRAGVAKVPGSPPPKLTGIAAVGESMRREFTVDQRLSPALAGGDTREHWRTLTHRERLAREAHFAAKWPWHKRDFMRLRNSILVEEGTEPGSLICSSPLGYGHPYRCGSGEYTTALSAAGAAVADVLERWEQERPNRDIDEWRRHLQRLHALAQRHPQSPWPAAVLALAWFGCEPVLPDAVHVANFGFDEDTRRIWLERIQQGRRAIALFERILGPREVAEYAGAKLSSDADGYGNEAFYYPTVLYFTAVACESLGLLDEAVRYAERASMMDLRDGAGARFLLTSLYTKLGRKRKPPASWDELTYGSMLRAVALQELRDDEAAVVALGVALHDRQWQEFANGYGHPPRTVKGLFRVAAPVGARHQDAWQRLRVLAARPDAQKTIRDRMLELEADDAETELLNSELRSAETARVEKAARDRPTNH